MHVVVVTADKEAVWCSGAMSGGLGAVFEESQRLLHVDSDRLHAVCASNAGQHSWHLFYDITSSQLQVIKSQSSKHRLSILCS